ncbi:MAG: DMT family transporter [Actinomycetota bacterium]
MNVDHVDRQFRLLDWTLAAALSLTWGSSFLLIAVAIDYLHPTVVPLGRALAGALALALFPGAWQPVARQHWMRIAALGLVWMAIPFWLFPLAELSVTSGVAGIINGGLPIVMALVTSLWVRRIPSKQRIVAISLGLIGIIVIVLPAIRAKSASGVSVAELRGTLLLLVAVTCYAIGANLARPLQAQFSPPRLLMRVQFAAALWTLPFAAMRFDESEFTTTAIGAVVVLGLVGTGLAFAAFGTLLERTGITRAMIPTYFTPIVGLVLGATFRDEQITAISVVGMFIVIGSAWMTSRPDERDVMLIDVKPQS